LSNEDLSKYVRFVVKALSNSPKRTFQQKVTSAHRAYMKGQNPLIHQVLAQRLVTIDNCEAIKFHREGLAPEVMAGIPQYANVRQCGDSPPRVVVPKEEKRIAKVETIEKEEPMAPPLEPPAREEEFIEETLEFDDSEPTDLPAGVWGSLSFTSGMAIVGANPDIVRESSAVAMGVGFGGGATLHLGRHVALYADVLSETVELDGGLKDTWESYAIRQILVGFGLEAFPVHRKTFAMSLYAGGGFSQYLAEADDGTERYDWGGPEAMATLGLNLRVFPHRNFDIGLGARLDMLFGGDNDGAQEWNESGAPADFGTAFSVVFRMGVHIGR
jgi:hypothetical protein